MTASGLSVVTITLNEIDNIGCFIESHRSIADELIVVDAGSTDGTAQYAEKLGCRVIRHPWMGYGRQWNVGLDAAKYEWILVGDADHEMTESLAQFIQEVKIRSGGPDAYLVPRRNYLGRRWIRHGGYYPDTPYARLFRRGVGRFDERVAVHEKLVYTRRVNVGVARGYVIHHTYRSVSDMIQKIDRYTSLEASQRKSLPDRSTRRSHLDPSVVRRRLPLRPLAVFLWRLVARGGFLDGRLGLYMALMHMWYEIVTDFKVYAE